MSDLLRLLIVEDNEEDAELIRLELESGGFELQWSRVYTEADLRRMLTEHEWDLIVSDFAMPQFDGLEAFDLVRSMNLDTPFIFVSAALGEERAVAAMRAGARDYLLKGDLGRLCAAVRRELNEAGNRRRLKLAQEQAARQKVRLEAALAATDAGLFEVSRPELPERHDTYVSERLAQMLGYAAGELIEGGPVLEWMLDQVHPDDLARSRQAFERLIRGEHRTVSSELRLRHRDGSWIDAGVYAIALDRDSRGEARRVVGVMLDVSEARDLERRYLQAQKMEAIGRLAGGVAHDFNNLLTAIISFAGFVRDDLDESDPRRSDLGEVLAAAERAVALTRQLLLFSRQQPARMEPIDMCSSIQTLQRLLTRTLGEDIELTTELPDEPLGVRADSNQLGQVVLNLAVNARDAMPGGGALEIAVRRVGVGDERARRLDLEPGDYVQLSVIDTGSGMSDEVLKRIFEPFFTTKGPAEGTGLGLATCYGIVRQLGGAIEVESELGVGTTVNVLLPRFEGQLAGATPEPRAGDTRGNETILVVEDERALRRVVERVLRASGYTVVLAEDADEALGIVERDRNIDLVFSDVILRNGNGFELADVLRARYPRVRVLLTSGYSDQRTIREGSDIEILSKPYTPKDLVARVRSALDLDPG